MSSRTRSWFLGLLALPFAAAAAGGPGAGCATHAGGAAKFGNGGGGSTEGAGGNASTGTGGSDATAGTGGRNATASSGGGGDAAGTGGGGAGGAGGAGGSTPCAGVYSGDFTINTAADVATLSVYCGISGDLYLGGPGLTDIDLPVLQDIEGDLVGAPSDMFLVTLRLPALTHVQSFNLNPTAQSLVTVDFASLETVDGDFIVPGPTSIGALALPSLRTVGGDFDCGRGATGVDAAALESVGGKVSITGVQTLSAPALATIGGALEIGADGFETLDLPALTSIGTSLSPAEIALDLDPDEGSTLCMPANGNASLVAFTLPLLANLGAGNTGGFNLGDDPLLPLCRVDALAQQLQNAGWTGQVVVANGGCLTAAGPCP